MPSGQGRRHDRIRGEHRRDDVTNGDWEHEHGVSIETLDNPGWFLKLDLRETGVDGLTFAKQEVHRSKNDWLIAQVVDDRYEVACGPLNLGEAIHQFRLWVTSQHRGDC